MKFRDLFAIALMLCSTSALAQVNPGTTPLSGPKGGTGNAFMQFTGPASSLKTYTIPNVTGTLAMLSQIQTWTGAQSFTDGTLVLLGSSSGSSTLKAPSTGGGTVTLFPGSDTVMGLVTSQSPTNKTISGSTNVLGDITMTLGSDATGDIYYRNSSGILTRLGIGGSANVLTVSGGLPAWVAATGGGNVSNTGTPTANQIAQWTNATTIQGISTVGPPQGGTGVASPTAHTIPINEGSSNFNNTGTGVAGQSLFSNGAADPSFQSGAPVLLATLTPTNVASINDQTACNSGPCITSAYNEYEFVFENLLPSTNAVSCEIQVYSTTLQTGTYLANELHFNGGAVASITSTTFIPCSGIAFAANSGTGISGRFTLYKPSQTSSPKSITGQFSHSFSTSALNLSGSTGGYWNGGNTAVTGISVQFSSGNITSGTIKIYGIL